MSKLTPDQETVLSIVGQAQPSQRIRFASVRLTEAACQLDTMGLVYAYADPSQSIGDIWCCITGAGRKALKGKADDE